MTVRGYAYPANFVTLHQSSFDVILGTDFLSEHKAINELHFKVITLATNEAIPSNTTLKPHVVLNIIDEVTVPPRSSVVIPVGARNIKATEGVIEGNTQLLLHGDLGIARDIARFRNGHAQVLRMNFSEGYQNLYKGTTSAFLDKLADNRNVAALPD